MTARHPELAEFIRDRALQTGEFRLSSGATSSYYIDGKQISFDPRGIWLTVEAILRELANRQFDAVGGMDMGGTPIVSALALRSHELRTPIPTFTVRKNAKTHGLAKRIEGLLEPGTAAVVVDDTVTTGGSIVQAVEAVREHGCRVVLAISIVDRDSGAAQRLEELGIDYQPLVTLADLGVSNEPVPARRAGGAGA